MSMISKGADGWYHPESNEQLQQLVRFAHDQGIKVRVKGAGLSTPKSVHNDDHDGSGAPPAGAMAVVLDKMQGVVFEEEHDDHAIVAVQAGCLLGRAYDDRTGATWPGSLSYVLQKKGYALGQLAGVSHQVLAGFMMTGSAGGSIRHGFLDQVLRLQIVDGTGKLHDLRRDDPNPEARDRFFAAGVSMGLFGVLARVWMRVQKTYNVTGGELSVAFDEAPIDMAGSGKPNRPSLASDFAERDYARVLWWPQNDLDRVQIWHAEQIAPKSDFEPQPFEVLSKAESLLGSLVYTILGNLDDLSAVPAKLEPWHAELTRTWDGHGAEVARPRPGADKPVTKEQVLGALKTHLRRAVDKHPDFNEGAENTDADYRALIDERAAAHEEEQDGDWTDRAADILLWGFEKILDGYSGKALAAVLKGLLPGFIDELLGMFITPGERSFQESWMHGIPMDNGMEEALWRTDFTELWIPIDKAAQAVQAMKTYYAADGDKDEAYRRTGPFTVELYCGKGSDFWMSPGYGDEDFLRVNVFWFNRWAGSPCDSFYPAIWELLEPFGFRTHWGKHLPKPGAKWLSYYKKQLPKLDAFLKLREQFDPKQIFVSSYWRAQFAIPAP